VRCQREIIKAGEKFVRKSYEKLDSCLSRISTCVHTIRPGKQVACISKARTKCDAMLAKILDENALSLESRVLKACQVEGELSAIEVLAEDGLSFADVDTHCQDLGIVLNGVGDIAECIRRHAKCGVERLLRFEFPRALEFLHTAGVDTTLLDELTCLSGTVGVGGEVGASDPKGARKGIDSCGEQTLLAGAKLVRSRLMAIGECVGEVFKCVQMKPADATCFEKATDECAAEIGTDGKLAKVESKLRSSVHMECGPVDFGELAGPNGMNLDDIASECAPFGVASLKNLEDYVECLNRQHDCLVGEMIRMQVPRVEEVLAMVGFEDEWVPDFCP
jgi:hypothetical protein